MSEMPTQTVLSSDSFPKNYSICFKKPQNGAILGRILIYLSGLLQSLHFRCFGRFGQPSRPKTQDN